MPKKEKEKEKERSIHLLFFPDLEKFSKIFYACYLFS